jgi:hypothetical protein
MWTYVKWIGWAFVALGLMIEFKGFFGPMISGRYKKLRAPRDYSASINPES